MKRDEIILTELYPVMEAAILLRKNGLISIEQLGEIRKAVHADCCVIMERHGWDGSIASALSAVWDMTRPLEGRPLIEVLD